MYINLQDCYKYDAGRSTTSFRPPAAAAAGMSASTSSTASIATGTSSTANGGGGSGGRTSGSTSSSTVTRASRRHDFTEKYLVQKPLGVLGSSCCWCQQPRAVGVPTGGDVCDDDGIHLCPNRSKAFTCRFVLRPPERCFLAQEKR